MPPWKSCTKRTPLSTRRRACRHWRPKGYKRKQVGTIGNWNYANGPNGEASLCELPPTSLISPDASQPAGLWRNRAQYPRSDGVAPGRIGGRWRADSRAAHGVTYVELQGVGLTGHKSEERSKITGRSKP